MVKGLYGIRTRTVCGYRYCGASREVVNNVELVVKVKGVFVNIAQATQPGIVGGYALDEENHVGLPVQVHPELVGVAIRGQGPRLGFAQVYGS